MQIKTRIKYVSPSHPQACTHVPHEAKLLQTHCRRYRASGTCPYSRNEILGTQWDRCWERQTRKTKTGQRDVEDTTRK